MSNESIWLLFIVFDFSFAMVLIYLFGKHGLYLIVSLGIIACNIQVLKLVELFGQTVSLGNTIYGSIFLSTDLISECYGKKEAKRAVTVGLAAMVFFTTAIQVAILMNPSPADIYHNHMVELFKLSPRIAFASVLAYIISQYHDIWAFDWWKTKTKGKHLWLRNNLSTVVSQCLDSIVFVCVAFVGIYEFDVLISILLTTISFKCIVAIVDTPVIYLGRKILKRHVEGS